MKECIILLDGIDKSGKTSILKALVKRSNGKLLVIDRSFISQIVYSRIYNRQINEKFFIDQAKIAFQNGYKFFIITANTDIIEKRFKICNEKDLDISDIFMHKQVLFNVLNDFNENGIKINIIDTSYKSIDESVGEIINNL